MKEPISAPIITRVCPECGRLYTGAPALSRKDNATYICPDCGILEALEYIGCAPDERVRILDTIHAHTERR